MGKIISIIDNKGGVGKTSSTGILAELLAFTGCRVLCVDLDQQSNLSMLFNCYVKDPVPVLNWRESPEEENKNITELFRYRYRSREEIGSLIKPTFVKNLYIIPSSKRHQKTPDQIIAEKLSNNNTILKKGLATIRDDYDFILIDNAPASDILTVNSIFASDYVLTPVRIDGFSYKGLEETLDTITYIKEEHDVDSVSFLGTFVTQAERNTVLYRDLKESYTDELGGKFFQTSIRKDIRVSEIETIFKPILDYAPNTNAVYDYTRLILEMNILPEDKKKVLEYAIGEREDL